MASAYEHMTNEVAELYHYKIWFFWNWIYLADDGAGVDVYTKGIFLNSKIIFENDENYLWIIYQLIF